MGKSDELRKIRRLVKEIADVEAKNWKQQQDQARFPNYYPFGNPYVGIIVEETADGQFRLFNSFKTITVQSADFAEIELEDWGTKLLAGFHSDQIIGKTIHDKSIHNFDWEDCVPVISKGIIVDVANGNRLHQEYSGYLIVEGEYVDLDVEVDQYEEEEE